ncbi:MAG: type II toxin-antitoxin system RelE/ParE family toxin [Acidobacteria bacterium]|nr:type II toxin-antitoxin system RelE/ParE family toxin [Acidobacteriota bacterium]
MRLSPPAERDVRDIYIWYKTQSESLASQFRNSLEDCLERVRQNPTGYAKVHGEVRRALLRRFPYCVFYVIREWEVGVLGVFHGHRDPKTWQSRPIA